MNVIQIFDYNDKKIYIEHLTNVEIVNTIALSRKPLIAIEATMYIKCRSMSNIECHRNSEIFEIEQKNGISFLVFFFSPLWY